jgi:hypothetical protein
MVTVNPNGYKVVFFASGFVVSLALKCSRFKSNVSETSRSRKLLFGDIEAGLARFREAHGIAVVMAQTTQSMAGNTW